MKTLNALQTACAKFNGLDEWVRFQPDCEALIQFAMKQRKNVNKSYVEDLENFDTSRFWTQFHEQINASDNEDSEDEDEV